MSVKQGELDIAKPLTLSEQSGPLRMLLMMLLSKAQPTQQLFQALNQISAASGALRDHYGIRKPPHAPYDQGLAGPRNLAFDEDGAAVGRVTRASAIVLALKSMEKAYAQAPTEGRQQRTNPTRRLHRRVPAHGNLQMVLATAGSKAFAQVAKDLEEQGYRPASMAPPDSPLA